MRRRTKRRRQPPDRRQQDPAGAAQRTTRHFVRTAGDAVDPRAPALESEDDFPLATALQAHSTPVPVPAPASARTAAWSPPVAPSHRIGDLPTTIGRLGPSIPSTPDAALATMPHGRSWKLPLLLCALTVPLALLEVGMRLAGMADVVTFAPSETWGYLMRPNQRVFSHGVPVRINSMGLRGPEIADPKRPDELRVLFIGDSVTYGGGRIAEGEIYCRVLESLAQRDGLPVQAVNLSAPGWSPQNWMAFIEARGLLDADVVVLALPSCDLDRPFATMAMHGFRSRAPVTRVGSLTRKLVASARNRHPYQGADPAAEVGRNVAAVTRLRTVAAAPELVAVWIPSAPPDHGRYWSRFEPLFSDALDLRPLLTTDDYLDRIHLNAGGHRRVGEALYGRLQPVLAELARARSAPLPNPGPTERTSPASSAPLHQR